MCVCAGYKAREGVTKTSTLCFDYSNYDSERGIDYYEHMDDEFLMSSHRFNPSALPLKEADVQRPLLVMHKG